MLNVIMQNLSDIIILHCTGRLTLAEADTLRTALPQSPYRILVLDVAEVSRVDAPGLGALLSMRASCNKAGTALKLMNVSPMLQDLLKLTQLNSAFEICSGREMIDLLCRSLHEGEQEPIARVQEVGAEALVREPLVTA